MTEPKQHSDLFALASSLLSDNHSLSYKLKGYSMFPTLRAGDTAIIDVCKPESLIKGDIVVYKRNNILIAHRIVKIEKHNTEYLIHTKGDNNNYIDKAFSASDLLGKISSFSRNNKTININSLSQKIHRITALTFPNLKPKLSNKVLGLKNRLSSLKTIKQNIKLITQGSQKQIFHNAIVAVFQGILPFLVIVCIKSLIDFLTQSKTMSSSEQTHFIVLLVATALIFLFNGILSEIKSYLQEKLSQTVTRNIYKKLHVKHTKLDLAYYENPEEQNKIHRAVQESSYRPLKIINELLMGIKSIASSLFLVGIFISIKWYLIVILIIAIIPGIFTKLRFSRKLYRLKTEQSPQEREMYYFNRILTGIPFAKEQKLFGFSEYFLSKFNKTQNKLFNEKLALKKSEFRIELIAQAFSIILIFLSLGYVSYLKINGLISIGTVVLFFFAFQRGYSVLNELFRSVTLIIEDNTFLNDFIGFLNLEQKNKSKIDNEIAFKLENEIKISDLSFRYETSKRDALSHINISIPKGKTVAFVGANGSGKTSLIKLLCGFYQPTSGSIYFDNIDAANIDENIIRQNISAVFQDFALYNIAAINNIGLGRSETTLDIVKAKKAAQEAGVSEILENLPNGYHTLLGNLFNGGEELSIGQWQKIAIARAFYRDAPILLMDEPSSALDAKSEQQIIETLKKLSVNKTAIIISHRLTTVQWADKIYLFDQGKLIEEGTHRELMEQKGHYFSLFETANSNFNPTEAV